MRTPLNDLQLFAKLGELLKKMQLFKKNNGEITLTASEVALMAEIYPDVQVKSSGSMAAQLNTSCSGCIKEAFQIFISLYDRMARNPDINKNAHNVVAADNGNEEALTDNAPVDTRTEAEKADDERFDLRKAKFAELGFTWDEDKKFFNLEANETREARTIPGWMVKGEPDESFETNYANLTESLKPAKEEVKEEQKEEVKEVVQEVKTAGQKAAETRKANAEKKAAEGK